MGIDITTYRIRIGRFDSGRGYISAGIAEIYSSSITGSDINYKMLATMVLLTFLLKCCVITQQEAIMQDVYTFVGTDSASCQRMVHIAIYVNLYTRIRAVRPSTCTAFGHLIRAPRYFQTLGWIGFIYGLIIGIGSKFFSVPSPPPPMAWRSRSRTWKFIVVKISFPNKSFWSTVSYFSELSQTN